MRLTKNSTTAIILLNRLVSGSIAATTNNSAEINSLARDISRVESVREIKDVQRTFSQLAQFGQWGDMADLFAPNATLQWGNETASGRDSIERWLERDARGMDGIRPGSLDTLVSESPLVSLSADGNTAKARWNGLRFMGDGEGETRIQGGIYENEYVLSKGRWRFSRLHYHALYAGPYVGGWRNVGGPLPIVPYHFTPEDAGVPIPPAAGNASETTASSGELAHRINRMNDEDEVRNLQHAYGYYVDRRMWKDVVDLFSMKSEVNIEGVGSYWGAQGVLEAMVDRMGPENLTQGILNDHPIFDTVVDVKSNGLEAITRGIEIGMIGNANTHEASWEFSVFRNRFVKEQGVWKIKSLNIIPLIVANYSTGWGDGGILSRESTFIPPFLEVGKRSSRLLRADASNTTLVDLRRRLARAAAYDGAENMSGAYGYYLDDLRCGQMGAIHARKGNKASPFAGWFQTPERIAEACHVVYGRNTTPPMRSSISFHWRPQPVILVSSDGRSATLRARLLQPSTSTSKAGSFNGAIYHDQMVLEDGRWKLWSITIDEFYWMSPDWAGGWAAANPRSPNATDPAGSSLLTKYPPDATLYDVGDREAGFQGGPGKFISWPEIQRMWFEYRNPVSGRVPEHYWPGCVPCQARPDWSLIANGYQEPPTGPKPGNWNATLGIADLNSARRELSRLNGLK